MVIKLPHIRYDENGNKQKYEVEYRLDLSAYAEYRFKRFFRETTGKNSLVGFAQAVSQSLEIDLADALTIIYCFLEDENVPPFEDFLKLFDYSLLNDVTNALVKIINLAYSDATKN